MKFKNKIIHYIRKIFFLKDFRPTSSVYTTYDNKYFIRQKHSGGGVDWVVIECGIISEKVRLHSLEECRQYIYDCLRDDRGHKYKLDEIKELNRIEYSRLIVDYTVKVIKMNGDKKLFMEANIENISHGGCRVKINNLPTSFVVEECFTIQFNLADFNIHKNGKLEIEAIVRWTSLDGSEVGCKFIEMNDESEEIFTSILKTVLI